MYNHAKNMKTKFKFIIVLLLALISFQSCEDIDDTYVSDERNFIWKGLNFYYLWQEDVPNLDDNRFASLFQLNAFLYSYEKPEDLFESLLYKPDSRFPDAEVVDRFSWIVDDYLELEGQLQGNTNSNGVEFGLSYKSSNSNEIIGWVRYIVLNSDASTKNIKRGDIFYGVDGIQLTDKNYGNLLFGSNNDYTLNLANYDNGNFSSNGKSVALTKTPLEEDPILINKVIVSGSHKIGYLMYNGFYSNYDTELNNAFGTLKYQGITDLVLDLRYNGGGSVQTATRLASMITGSFTGQVFAKQQWNSKIESYYQANEPDELKDLFPNKIGSTTIQSVGMTKVYILTTKSTASASELVINGLAAYIDVIQIGDVTTGKNVGSITIYDSPTFGKKNRNPNHLYAMQPIVLKIVNAQGFGDYQSGLEPTYTQKESQLNLGVLGEITEPLLSTAITKITGVGKLKQPSTGIEFNPFSDSKSRNGLQNQMYIEKPPKDLAKALK
jgi:C-terminal processing protease CtpA/Prc